MNIQAVEAATQVLLAENIRVLNPFLLASTEIAHAARLLQLMDPPAGAVVLDAGCGVGEVAKLMQGFRQDLTFILQNISLEQLKECPWDMDRIHGDFAAIDLPDASVDVVMFNYSLCHSDNWLGVLQEARRVLREGGILFLNDFARTEPGDNTLMQHFLSCAAYTPDQIAQVVRQAGFELEGGDFHTPAVTRLREVCIEPALYDVMLEGVQPATFRCTKRTLSNPIADAFARHERIAFQFSGGRDSTAALFELREYWLRMTIYNLTTGDNFPETQAVIKAVRAMGVDIVDIESDVFAVREQFGLPSDLVPVDNYDIGLLVSGQKVKIQSRYDCCARTLMKPMHERMLADGITLIVRGQRDDEYATPPARSGDTWGGMEVLYPIQDWTAADVDAYLHAACLPVAPFYERGMKRAPECMGCTAWWDEGRSKYMRVHHRERALLVEKDINVVLSAIKRQSDQLE